MFSSIGAVKWKTFAPMQSEDWVSDRERFWSQHPSLNGSSLLIAAENKALGGLVNPTSVWGTACDQEEGNYMEHMESQ